MREHLAWIMFRADNHLLSEEQAEQDWDELKESQGERAYVYPMVDAVLAAIHAGLLEHVQKLTELIGDETKTDWWMKHVYSTRRDQTETIRAWLLAGPGLE